jgi:preprotein translocase, SecE subunit, bacterial
MVGCEFMAEEAKVSKLEKAGKNSSRFFREIRSELKKVIWPTREQLVNYTVTVLTFCLAIGVIIWVADFLFGQAFQFVLGKI